MVRGYLARKYYHHHHHQSILLLQQQAAVVYGGKEEEDLFAWARSGDYDAISTALSSSSSSSSSSISRSSANAVEGGSGTTLLMAAVKEGHKAIVELLLYYHADINAQDGVGNTALHYAKQCEQEEISDVLMEHGADDSIRNYEDHTCYYYDL